MKKTENTETSLWMNTAEIIKIEITAISLLYVVFGLLLTSISSHNTLLFSLAAPSKPNEFIPYWPIYNSLFYFSVTTVGCIVFGLFASFITEKFIKLRSTLFVGNIVCFIVALLIFTYQIYRLKKAFLFH